MDNTQSDKKLPENWVWTKVGDLDAGSGLIADGDWILSKDMASGSDVRLIQLADIGEGYFRNKSRKFLAKGRAVELGCTFLQPGDLLVSRMADPIARACRLPTLPYESITAVDVTIVRSDPSFFDTAFLSWLFNSRVIRDQAEALSSGTTRKRISRKNLQLLDVSLPPLTEQRRIVAKIEELFSQLDAGVAALDQAKAQLSRYRQAVLKHAFEGKLTEAWREAHKDELETASVLLERIKVEREKTTAGKVRGKPLPPLDTSELPELPELPEGWVWARLEQLSAHIVDCLHSTPKFTSEGKYCIDTTCIEPGRIVFDRARFVSRETYEDRIRRLEPQAGDVLFAREGTIGTAVIVPESVDLCLGQRMMMFRSVQSVASLYFMYAMMSPTFQRQWQPKVTGTTAPHINIRDIRLMALPLPSPAEQQEIVRCVEQLLSNVDEIQRTVRQSLIRGKALRQSILKRAFEGKLVPQDPNDELAQVLLERIKAEKARREA